MDLKKLSEPLKANQIDFRVQSISKGGYATILAYKDARVDMQRLDDVCGPLNWKREHTRENKNCIVSIWDSEKVQWVSKEDTGVESFTEKEKGLASDSFKRACFNWGIGRELYDYPVIQIKLFKDEFKVESGKAKATYKLKLRLWVWETGFDGGVISFLRALDSRGKERFLWEKHASKIGDDVPIIESPEIAYIESIDKVPADKELLSKWWQENNKQLSLEDQVTIDKVSSYFAQTKKTA